MTNKEKIAEIERLLAELKIEEEENKKEKTSGRWRAEHLIDYFCVDFGGDICCLCEDKHSYDNFRYDTHNYFKTRSEVEKYAEVLETERQLKRFADEHNEEITWKPDVFGSTRPKWHLVWNDRASEISKATACDYKNPRIIYFSSKEIANAAIGEIGKDKIAEYLKYEW